MPKLSRRETEVARLVAEGLSNRQIAERLFVSERTAEFHVEQIRNKLGFHSRNQIGPWLESQGRTQPPPGNLPPQLTSFVGRAHELAEVRALLGRTRVVTITGAGGTGKTRLAVEVATRAVDGFPDGAWFVDLQSLRDPGLLAAEVAAGLSVTDLERDLRSSRRLVVLDNCEQVAAACCDLAGRLLSSCRELRFLATSREPIGVPGEGVWTLRPLTPAEGVELFLERARLAAPDVDWSTAEPGLIRELCEDLDGIPLAIELAASRARVTSLADLRARLRQRFALLVGGGSASPRQRSLAATVAWSYDLLAPIEQRLFRRLGVFAGPFFRDSAEALAGEETLSAAELAELLDRLVDRSLVVAERAPDCPTRYRLLGSMREYARERLSEEGALDAMQARHAAHFASVAAAAGAELQGPQQASWLQRIDDELDEFRAAHAWMLESDPESALVIAAELDWFWGMRGRVTEGRQALAAAMARTSAVTVTRGRALIASGWLARLQGDAEVGAAFHAESVEVLQAFDDPVELGKALVWHAEAASGLNDWETARRGWEEAVELLAALGSSEPLAYALLELGMAELVGRNLDGARDYARRALAMFTQLGNARASALCHLPTSYAAHLEGRHDEAWVEIQRCASGIYEIGAFADLMWPLRIAAVEAIAAGAQAHGVQLAGAARTLVLTTGRSPQNNPIGAELEPALEAARAALGGGPYDDAWAQGLAMDAGAAVDLVLAIIVPTVRPLSRQSCQAQADRQEHAQA